MFYLFTYFIYLYLGFEINDFGNPTWCYYRSNADTR